MANSSLANKVKAGRGRVDKAKANKARANRSKADRIEPAQVEPQGITNRLVDLAQCRPHPDNYNAHPPEQIKRLRESIRTFGQVRSVVVQDAGPGTAGAPGTAGGFIEVAGHGVMEAMRAEGMAQVKADVIPANWTPAMVKAYLAADNELARLGLPDEAQLAALVDGIAKEADEKLAALAAGTEARLKELRESLAGNGNADAEPQIDRAEELQEKWNVQLGQAFKMGDHAIICGDCREPETWRQLLDVVGVEKVNGVFTSPPYAEQRKAQYGGVPTDKYVEWWEAVQANVKANLADDGSFFMNIKPHCEDGERVLYVFDLVLAMRRVWQWRFVDELCWLTTAYPGGWDDRFKNGFEAIYHFSMKKFKYIPQNVSTWGITKKYDGKDKKNVSGFSKRNQGVGYSIEGFVRPSNVIDLHNLPLNSEDHHAGGIHAAAFPVALPSFFIRAYSDHADIWLDPFCGSGTTIVAAEKNKRRGLGIELFPKYCAVILERMATAFPGIEIERIECQTKTITIGKPTKPARRSRPSASRTPAKSARRR